MLLFWRKEMYNKSILLFLAIFAAIVMVSCQSLSTGVVPMAVEPVETMSDWADNLIRGDVKSAGLAGGMAAMVYDNGEVIYAGGHGRAGEELGVNAKTPMPVGSISKIFTAVAIMQLVEEGLIDLDRSVGDYLKELKLADEAQFKFTIRDLLTHRSGIPGDLFQDWIVDAGGIEPMRRAYDLLNGRPMAAEPGEFFSYANLGYTLLGLLIEETSGLSYDTYIRTRIFEPAAMVNSQVYPGETDGAIPAGYTRKGTITVPAIRDVPAGGLLVSAQDMGSFVSALFDGRLIDMQTLSQMTSVQNARSVVDRDFDIGLGFWLIDPINSGELMASHGGDLPPAFHSVLITLPERGLAVFTAINDQRGNGTAHVDTAIEIIQELMERNGIPAASPVDRGRFLPVSPADRDLYSGTYGTIAGLVEVEAKGKAFNVEVAGNRLYFAPREYGRYGVQIRLLNAIPIPVAALDSMEFDMFEADGKVWMGIWMGGIYMGAFSKLEAVEYPDEYEEYIGSYSIEGGPFFLEDGTAAIDDIEIVKRSGRYIMALSLMGTKIEMALRPSGPNRALTDGTGRGMGDLLQFSKQGETMFLDWSGLHLVRNQ